MVENSIQSEQATFTVNSDIQVKYDMLTQRGKTEE